MDPEPKAVDLPALLDRLFLFPHQSLIKGAWIVRNRDQHGISVIAQLAVLAAESSLGDPFLGGRVCREGFNFGSVKFRPRTPENAFWWDLSTGEPISGERPGSGPWMAFPSADVGMEAWGRFIASSQGGQYLAHLNAERWSDFAAIYFGLEVPGYDEYWRQLDGFARTFRARAADAGVQL